ncbi:MAG: ParB/RepB/Spo0J family partition protein [Proteobacteria bacterium]|nr:ParB/RepB/Spo0J family partition protein [Pseudomonadota bacterium]MCH8951833.1 ParB/RepB/Spo0J family partition protein [Pseudomonadota bacterium]
MSKTPERRGLGRGLAALLGEIGGEAGSDIGVAPVMGEPAPVAATPPARPPASVPIERLQSNPDQPRRDFRETELNELAASIRQRGIIQPIVVRPEPGRPGYYQIVAGERRWRAAQRARLHEIPIVVREVDDRAMLELAIIENVQRSDLNPIEEASGYAQLIERFAHTQEAMSEIVGKSRSHVANTLRLLGLPEQVQQMLRSGKLSAGHARALINAADPVALAEIAVRKGLTVRQVEELARRVAAPRRRPRGHGGPKHKDADTRLLEGDLSAAIGMAVSIEHHGTDGGGHLRIRYHSLDELDRLCRKLAG